MRRRPALVFEIGEEQLLDDVGPEVREQPRPGAEAEERYPAADEPKTEARAQAAQRWREPEELEPDDAVEGLTDSPDVASSDDFEALAEAPRAPHEGAVRRLRSALAVGPQGVLVGGLLAAAVGFAVVFGPLSSSPPTQPTAPSRREPANQIAKAPQRRSRGQVAPASPERALLNRAERPRRSPARGMARSDESKQARRTATPAPVTGSEVVSTPAAPVPAPPPAPPPGSVAPAMPAASPVGGSAPATSADVGREFGP